MEPSNDDKLISILRREEVEAEDWQQAGLAAERERAFSYYDREPYGDEQTGQSAMVTSEFADTVESVMPSLMRVFAGSDEVVEFTPRTAGDEQAAREATEYVPHVFMRENDGYRILYWFLKDGLMYRLAGGCVDVEEVEQSRAESIPAMPADAFAIARLALEDQARASGAEIVFDIAERPSGTVERAADQVSGTIVVRRRVRRVRVDNIAPEDILFTPDCRDIDEASFLGYRKRATASDLRLLGVLQETIDRLADDRRYTVEQAQRQPDVIVADRSRAVREDSERSFWLVVAYVRFDENGDGISEMLRVVYAHAGGNGAEILEKTEWTDGEAPVFVGSPILMSHTVPGRSLFDQVRDLQDVGSVLMRGLLDNVYLTNRPRPITSEKVNLLDVIDWTPGQPIRLTQGAMPGEGHIQWMEVPSIIGPALTALQHLDQVKEKRTGVTALTQGIDADTLHRTATGIGLVASAAEQRLELIARTFAETSIKRLFRLLYRAIRRAASGPVSFWNGAGWSACDPSKWPDDMNLVVNVGLGTGSRQMQLQNLMMIAEGQKQMVAAQGGTEGPLVSKEQIANTFRKAVEAAGFRSTEQFVSSAADIRKAAEAPLPASDPDPAMLKLQAELALKREAAQSDMALKREQALLDMQLAREKAALDAELKRQQIDVEAELEAYKIAKLDRPGRIEVQQQEVGK